jgi:hypothetical protein
MSFAALLDDIALAGPEGLNVAQVFDRATVAGLLPVDTQKTRTALLRDLHESVTTVNLLNVTGGIIHSAIANDAEGALVASVVAGIALARRVCGVAPEVQMTSITWRILWFIGSCRTTGASTSISSLRKAAGGLPIFLKANTITPLLAA